MSAAKPATALVAAAIEGRATPDERENLRALYADQNAGRLKPIVRLFIGFWIILAAIPIGFWLYFDGVRASYRWQQDTEAREAQRLASIPSLDPRITIDTTDERGNAIRAVVHIDEMKPYLDSRERMTMEQARFMPHICDGKEIFENGASSLGATGEMRVTGKWFSNDKDVTIKFVPPSKVATVTFQMQCDGLMWRPERYGGPHPPEWPSTRP